MLDVAVVVQHTACDDVLRDAVTDEDYNNNYDDDAEEAAVADDDGSEKEEKAPEKNEEKREPSKMWSATRKNHVCSKTFLPLSCLVKNGTIDFSNGPTIFLPLVVCVRSCERECASRIRTRSTRVYSRTLIQLGRAVRFSFRGKCPFSSRFFGLYFFLSLSDLLFRLDYFSVSSTAANISCSFCF